MAYLKKILPVLFLLFCVYIWYFSAHIVQTIQPTKVLEANTNISLYVEPRDGEDPIIQEINGARSEVLVEVYLLSAKDVITALGDAKSRGVDVRVMMEEHPFGGGNLNPKTRTELEGKGVSVSWTNPAFALTHEKTITIDDREVFILSQNLTASAFSKNREYDVLDLSPPDVSEVRTIFMDDWDRKSFSPPESSSLLISPINSRKIISALISASQASLDLETEDINDRDVINLLSEKAKTQRVRLITPTIKQLASNSKALNQLEASGVEVRTLSSPYIHAKLILSDQKTAYVGSVNLSTQSLDENREVGIILGQNADLQTLSSTFDADWNKSTNY